MNTKHILLNKKMINFILMIDTFLPSAKSVSQSPRHCPEHGAGHEPSNIEEGDAVLLVAVPGVQLVDVGSLQPVAEQGGEVGREKGFLEPVIVAGYCSALPGTVQQCNALTW